MSGVQIQDSRPESAQVIEIVEPQLTPQAPKQVPQNQSLEYPNEWAHEFDSDQQQVDMLELSAATPSVQDAPQQPARALKSLQQIEAPEPDKGVGLDPGHLTDPEKDNENQSFSFQEHELEWIDITSPKNFDDF